MALLRIPWTAPIPDRLIISTIGCTTHLPAGRAMWPTTMASAIWKLLRLPLSLRVWQCSGWDWADFSLRAAKSKVFTRFRADDTACRLLACRRFCFRAPCYTFFGPRECNEHHDLYRRLFTHVRTRVVRLSYSRRL